MPSLTFTRLLATVSLLLPALFAHAQREEHGRKYKPPPPTATIVITVQKRFNGKALPNASVVFHAERDGKDDGNLEMKTDPDGKATMDLLAVGDHVTVQVIADGYATYASDFDLTAAGKQVDVLLERPRAQVSAYGVDSDGPAQVHRGIQEHDLPPAVPATPAAAAPASVSPIAPMTTVPPADTPSTAPAPGSPSTATPGSPQA